MTTPERDEPELEAAADLPRSGAMDPGQDPRRERVATPFVERTPGVSPFPPIAEYGFLSDCHTAALVAPDGTVEWLCPPRFDSPSVFAAMLDRSAGGFRFGPSNIGVPAGRRYEPGTNILETTWMTATGWLVVRDALIIGRWRERTAGATTAHTRPPDGLRELPLPRAHDHVRPRPGADRDALRADVRLRPHARALEPRGGRPAQRRRLGRRGPPRAAHLGPAAGHRGLGGPRPPPPGDGRDALLRAVVVAAARRPALGRRGAGGAADHERVLARLARRRQVPRPPLARAPAALGARPQGPDLRADGAMVAAPTTSLPETPGGERNWDYRYTWMRDATFTLSALNALGLEWEADDFIQFVADAERNEDGALQIMYGIGGRALLGEQELDHLTGYENARPVRIGNGAHDQRQNDVYGAVLDSLYLHTKEYGHNSQRLWPVIEDQVRRAVATWRLPDQGIWEARGEPKHYTSSKLMCWVALDRGARLAARRGKEALADEWREVANEIHAEICEEGVDDRGVFVQHYGSTALDASCLLIPLVRFLPHDDPRVCRTVLAIADELSENDLVLRYRTDETDDGLSGEEGTFLICSFWLVSALLEIGERKRGRQLCERLLSLASSLDLYAEELDAATGRHLGNFPQAFTHLALINAVMHVIRDEASVPLA
jgi:GH15 family glucan-1,4-alpha-glucosidase